MGAFSARVERHESTLRFLTNGERIAPDDTCEKWGLEDGDIIEVFNEQIGGGDEMQVEGEAKEERVKEERPGGGKGSCAFSFVL